MKIKSVFFLTLIMSASFFAVADKNGFSVTPSIGYFEPDSDRAIGSSGIDGDIFGSLGLGYKFNNPWQVELVYALAPLESEVGAIDVDAESIHLDALYHFNEDSSINPYLAVGAGHAEYDVDGPGNRFGESNINYGAGVKWGLNQLLSLRTDFRAFRDFDGENVDYAFTLGLQFLFGGSQASKPVKQAVKPVVVADIVEGDSDGDGVVDSADRCADTLRGIEVDVNGCALDNDRDGVPNHADSCPDSDIGAKVDVKGCYIILKESREIQLQVNFASNSDVVTPGYFDQIEAVAEFMRAYPATNVVIEGHTDSSGAESYNQQLSQRRAANVAEVLVRNFGVVANRVSSIGYGEQKPIANNDTIEGKKKNRRVIAVISANIEKRAE